MRGPLNGFQIDAVFVHLVKGGHVAELSDLAHDEIGYEVDLFRRVEAPDTKADRRVRQLFIEAHRAQHVARLQAGAGAGRAAGDGHVLDGHHQPFTLHEREGQVEVAGQASLWVAIQSGVVEA